jgi:hypothetical protein
MRICTSSIQSVYYSFTEQILNRYITFIMKNYIGIGVALGAGVGTAIGVALHNTAIGIAVGVAVGIVFAAALNPHRKGKQ